MADSCPSLMRGKAVRVTQLDACGAPVLVSSWPVNATSTGFVSVQAAPQLDEGQEVNQKNANGDICVLDAPRPYVKWDQVTIVFCNVNPQIFALVTGAPLVSDASSNAIGFRRQRTIQNDKGIALELWTGTKSPGSCVVGQHRSTFGYMLWPFVTSNHVMDVTVENNAVNFTIVGRALAGGSWGVGPYDIMLNAAALGPLATVIGPDDLQHFQVTDLAPPPGLCGLYQKPIDFSLVAGAAQLVTLTYTSNPSAHANTVDWGDGTVVAGNTTLPGTLTHTYPQSGQWIVYITDTVTGSVRAHAVVSAP